MSEPTCTTCGRPLEKPDAPCVACGHPTPRPDGNFVPVHVFEGVVEKAMIQEILTHEQIPFVIEDHSSDMFEVALRNQLGAGRLLVFEDSVDATKALIEELKKASYLEDDSEPPT